MYFSLIGHLKLNLINYLYLILSVWSGHLLGQWKWNLKFPLINCHTLF